MHFSLENTGRLKYKYVEKFVTSKMTFISGIMKQSTKIFMLYPMVLKSSLFQVVQKYKLIYKVGPVFPMVIWSEFRLGKYRDDDHREDAPHFNIGCIIHSLHQDPAFGQILNAKQVFESKKRHFIEII